MKLIVPYVEHDLYVRTYEAAHLHTGPVYFCKVAPGSRISGETRGKLPTYPQLLARLWEEGEPFLLLEQDMVPEPGQLRELAECPEPWCVFDYLPGGAKGRDLNHSSVIVQLGCAKFSAEFIAATSRCWEMWDDPDWRKCDLRLTAFARGYGTVIGLGQRVHEHKPNITHLYNGRPRPDPDSRGDLIVCEKCRCACFAEAGHQQCRQCERGVPAPEERMRHA